MSDSKGIAGRTEERSILERVGSSSIEVHFLADAYAKATAKIVGGTLMTTVQAKLLQIPIT